MRNYFFESSKKYWNSLMKPDPIIKLAVTGRVSFTGPAVIFHLIHDLKREVFNADELTNAGNLESLE